MCWEDIASTHVIGNGKNHTGVTVSVAPVFFVPLWGGRLLYGQYVFVLHGYTFYEAACGTADGGAKKGVCRYEDKGY